MATMEDLNDSYLVATQKRDKQNFKVWLLSHEDKERVESSK